MPKATPAPHRSTGWTGGRIALVVLGSIAALIGAALLAGGGILLWADRTQRDDDGYLTSPRERFESNAHAIASEPIDLVSSDPDVADWLLSDDVLGDVRLRVSGENVFLGVGPSDEADAYLRDVGHDRVSDLDPPDYERRRGGAPPSPPADQRFWAATVSGSGEQVLT